MKFKIAVFSPFGVLREWRLQELYISKACFKLGHSVDLLECRGFQSYCFAIASRGISGSCETHRKDSICELCNYYKDLFFDAPEINRVNLGHLLKDEERSSVDKIVALGKKVPLNFKYKNISLGRISRNHVCIKNQEIDPINMPRTSEEEFKVELKSCLLMILTAKKLWREKKYDFLFLQNGMYPSSKCLSEVAKNSGTKVVALSGGLLKDQYHQSLRFSSLDYYSQQEINLKLWEKEKYKNKFSITPAIKSLNFHIAGKSIRTFSKPPNNKLNKKIQNNKFNKKILVILSSQDELIVAKLLNYKKQKKDFKHVFKNQYEWINFVLKVAKKHEKFLFIFRPHPRDWKNSLKKNGLISQNGEKIVNILVKQNYNNVFIDLPEQGLSVYDLIKDSDIILNGWSTVGQEAVSLGKNVCTIFPSFCNYPAKYTRLVKNKNELIRLIISPSHKKINLKAKRQQKKMLRWTVFNALNSEEAVPDFNKKLKDFDKPKNIINKIIKKILPRKMFNKILQPNNLLLAPNQKMLNKIKTILKK